MIINLEHAVQDAEVDEFEVVHFSNYLKWYSNALKEFLAAHSTPPGFFGDGVEIRVARVKASYSNSALRGDTVTTSITRAENLGRSLRLNFKAESRGKLLARAELNLVFVQREPYRLLPVPQAIADRIDLGRAA
ncbi:acyl-CoA thioesterase [Streptomyces sp. NPDC058221]|uniref:acyl-CoA thioesterase n=1 Tax=Streptomyces sp. NPDC058221 TaxID=3346388 RepID=UPI0036E257A1